MVAINHWSEVRIRPLWEWAGTYEELKTLPPKMNLPKATVTVEEKEDPHEEILESGHWHLSCVCFCFCCSENSPVGEVIHLLRQIGLLSSFVQTCLWYLWCPFGADLDPFCTGLVFIYLKIVIWAQSGTFLGPHNFVLLFEPALALGAALITLL